MKSKISVVSLFLRSSFYKALVLMGVSLSLQAGIFLVKLQGIVFSLEDLVEFSPFKNIFMACEILLSLLLIYEFASIAKSFKTRLLDVPPRKVYFCEAAAGSIIFALWLLSEAVLMLILSFVYINSVEAEAVTTQTLFLAFYRSKFLHFLVPMEDFLLYLKNLLIIGTLGMSACTLPSNNAKVSPFQLIAPAFVFVGTVFEFGFHESYISIPILMVILLVIYMTRCSGKDVNYEIAREN